MDKNKPMETTIAPWLKPFPRQFVSSDLSVRSWNELAPYFKQLADRPIADLNALKGWLRDWSEVQSIAMEEGTSRNIRMTCHTDNEAYKSAFFEFVEKIQPRLKEANFNLCKKFHALPDFKGKLGVDFKEIADQFSNQIDLFLPENLPLEEEVERLSQNYQELTGGWTVRFNDAERTMPEMSVYLQSTERAERETAWRAMADRRIQDSAKLDQLYFKLLEKRQRIAQNLKLANYRDYVFKRNRREYTPDDCFEFHESVINALVPTIKRIRSERQRKMGLKELKPWDLSCDPLGREPLKPFSDAERLQNGVEEIFERVDPRLKDYFHSIRSYQDLDSRKGKAPGGYQATYEERRIPFIFTNAAGVQHDVETLLHEAGHAFHTLQSRNQEYFWNLDSPMEFCEVSSMSQELIGGEHFGVFYKTEEEGRRARKQHLEMVLEIFPWIMNIDAFQHRIYAGKNLTEKDFGPIWLKEHQRFEAGVSWAGIDSKIQSNFWHKQLHIFLAPFYYIEYAISQIGALQIYRNYRQNPKVALDKFLNAMALGGSRSCQEIYKTAGIEFRFDEPFIRELAQMVEDEIKSCGD